MVVAKRTFLSRLEPKRQKTRSTNDRNNEISPVSPHTLFRPPVLLGACWLSPHEIPALDAHRRKAPPIHRTDDTASNSIPCMTSIQ